MLHTSRSSLRIIETFIGLVILVSWRRQIYADFHVCDIPKNFTLETLSSESNVKITQAELHIYFKEDSIDAVNEDNRGGRHPRTATHRLKFKIGSVTVFFRGYLEEAMNYGNVLGKVQLGVATESVRIAEHYDGSISGVMAYNQPTLNSSPSALASLFKSCHIAVTLARTNRPNNAVAIKMSAAVVHPDEIEREVRRLTESCVRHEMCPEIIGIQSKTGNKSSRTKRCDFRKLGQVAVYRPLLRTAVNNIYTTTELVKPLPLFSKTVNRKLPWIGPFFLSMHLDKGTFSMVTRVRNLFSWAYDEPSDMALLFQWEISLASLTILYANCKLVDEEGEMNGAFGFAIRDLRLRFSFTPHWRPIRTIVVVHTLHWASRGWIGIVATGLERAFPPSVMEELSQHARTIIYLQIDKYVNNALRAKLETSLSNILTPVRPIIDQCYG